MYGMLADGDWYPAHVIMVRINAMDEEEYDIEYEVFFLVSYDRE